MTKEEYEYNFVTTEVRLTQREMLLIDLALQALNCPKYTDDIKLKINKAYENLENELKELTLRLTEV